MEYVHQSMLSTVNVDILSRWEGLPIMKARPKREEIRDTIDDRLQELSVLSDDISKKWEGPNTLEEIRFQREKDSR